MFRHLQIKISGFKLYVEISVIVLTFPLEQHLYIFLKIILQYVLLFKTNILRFIKKLKFLNFIAIISVFVSCVSINTSIANIPLNNVTENV